MMARALLVACAWLLAGLGGPAAAQPSFDGRFGAGASAGEREALRAQVLLGTRLIDEKKLDEGLRNIATAAKRYRVATWVLAFIHAEGIGTPVDARRAAAHLVGERAGRTEAEASYTLGTFYDTGFWVEDVEQPILHWALLRMGFDEEAVRDFFRRQGPRSATYRWSDPERALGWYRKGAEGGHVGAQVNLARIHFDDRSEAWNCAEGLRWLRPVAEKGDATALTNMGIVYSQGPDRSRLRIGIAMVEAPEGIKIDQVDEGGAAARAGLRAGDIIVLANGQPGTVLGMGGLQSMVGRSEGVAISLRFRRAGETEQKIDLVPDKVVLKCPGAEAAGLRQDHVEAFKWFQKAANAGHPTGRFFLAQAYREGKGTARDPGRAVTLFKQGAGNGDWESAQALAHMYGAGEGVERNKELSEEWFSRAIQLKHRSLGR